MLSVRHNLFEVSSRLDNIPNDLKEIISRVFMDSYEPLKSELESQFGDAIRYAEFDLSYSGNTYSITINNLNEFVTQAQTGSDATDIASFAEEYLRVRIEQAVRSSSIGGLR